MSSLVPGTIFVTSGLNRKSTPTPPNITPAQLDQKYRRVDFNGHDWPTDSPVSRSYDVCNTSTKLIILNNKYGKNSTRLRGYYTGPRKPERHIDPDRHRAPSPRNPRFHVECYNSSSPKFEPTIKTDLEWINSSQRPPNALIARTSVNPKRHASCRASPDLPALPDDRPHSRFSLPPKRFFNSSEFADLSMGEKIYLWSIEKIYSMDKMKRLKQEQYRKLLDMEAKKGCHGYQEYLKYMRYIDSAKDRSYGTGSPADKRARSSSSPRSIRSRSASSRTGAPKSQEDKGIEKTEPVERPKTSIGQVTTEHVNDSKPPVPSGEEQPRSTSGASEERKSTSDQKSPSKSPSPSRKSSAKSQRSASGSQRSLRSQKSKSSSRSASAPRIGEKKKGDKFSDNSLTNGEEEIHSLHKEGRDRPLSRLGHPGADDRDKGSLHSSTLSIKSDNNSISSDSGVGNGRTPKATRHTSYPIVATTEDKKTEKTGSIDDKLDEKNKQPVTKSEEKNMGSRVSLSSRSSTSDESGKNAKENQETDNNLEDNQDDKPKTYSNFNAEKSVADEKVLKIPDASMSKEETGFDIKTDDEKDMKETNQTNIKETEKVDEKEESLAENTPDIQLTKSKPSELDRKEGILKLAEAIENADNQEEEKEKEKADLHVHYEDEQTNLQKTESDSENNLKHQDSDLTDDVVNQQEQKDEHIKEQIRLVPKRRDSFFDEDDEDRRANKDLDKIEY